MQFLRIVARHCLVPDNFSGCLVDAEGMANLATFRGTCQEQLVPPVDRRGLACARQLDFPLDGILVPFVGNIGLRGDTSSLGSSEVCPGLGLQEGDEKECQKRRQEFQFHGLWA